MIVLRRYDGYISVSANVGESLVRRGHRVRRDDVIATVAMFELRRELTPVDPLSMLPQLRD